MESHRGGLSWVRMDGARRRGARTLAESAIPTRVGVYAWYHDGEPVYVGRAIGATGLRRRIGHEHLGTTSDLSRSAFRRNICDFLQIADTSVTRARPPRLSAREIEPVNQWIRASEVAWLECKTEAEAKELEAALLEEWKPPLNRR